MKFSSTFVAFGMLQAVLAQSIAPSPTESIGCEPHGDHWHCEGPRPTDDAASAETSASEEADETSAAATTSAAEDEADETSSVDPGPSPTESEGCEPHGDHWHCEGPAETGSGDDADASDDADADDDSSSVDPGPSPTESEGCEPHGDHWHCDGPAETGAEDDADETDAPDAGVGALSVNIAAVVGVAAFALA